MRNIEDLSKEETIAFFRYAADVMGIKGAGFELRELFYFKGLTTNEVACRLWVSWWRASGV